MSLTRQLKSLERLLASCDKKTFTTWTWRRTTPTKDEAEAVVSKGGSLEHIIDEIYEIPPQVPTFRCELAAQTVLNGIWLRIDETKQHEARAKKHQKERIKCLAERQMDMIGAMIENLALLPERSYDPSALREQALMYISQKNDEEALGIIWFLGLWIQRKAVPIDAMAEYINTAETLSEFLTHVPRFQLAFDVSNKPIAAMVEYINNHVDPELDLLSIGMQMGTENAIDWYNTARCAPFRDFCERYIADKGVSSVKSITLSFNGKRFFSDDLNRRTDGLGLVNGDVILVSRRPPAIEARVPLKEIQVVGTSKGKSKPKSRSLKGAKGSGKKPTLYVSPEDEMDRLKQQHSEAMSSVFEEVDQRFRGIRERLTALTLQRTLPKERSKAPKPPATAAPISNPAAAGVAGKAGKSTFLVLVGEAENLYKTSKNRKGKKRRQPKSKQAANIAKVDLHGMTTEQALNRLDRSLPGWMDAAMKGSYPFVIKVQIVCGCGNQVLADAVEAWIRLQKNVANAPKNGS